MNIWILNPNAVPPSLGGLTRHYYFKKHLEELGHQVSVFTSSAIYNRDINLLANKNNDFFEIKKIDNEEFIYIKIPDNKSTIKRLINIHRFCNRVLKIAKKNYFSKPDIIYASYSPDFEVGALASKLSKIMKVPFVIENRDYYPETLVSLNVIKNNGIVFRIFNSITKRIFEKSDAIFFLTPNGKQYFVDKKWDFDHGGKIDLKKVYIVPNGCDIETFNFQKEHYLSNYAFNKKSIVYTGSMGRANDLDRLLDVAKLLTNNDFEFVLFGNGLLKQHLKERISNEKITNVVLNDEVNGVFVPSILSKSYLTLVIQANIYCDSLYGISSNKSFQYMAAGKPICCLINCPFPEFDNQRCGIHIKNVQPDIIAKELITFLSNLTDDKYERMSLNALDLSRKYDYKKISFELDRILKRIVNDYKKRMQK